MADKRRLPVLRAPEAPPEEEPRPPWHWVGFGVVGIFGAWLPLMALAQRVSARLVESALGHASTPEDAARAVANATPEVRARVGLALAAPHAVALALAAIAGGYLVGRYGKGLGPREALVSGLALAVVVGGLTYGAVGFAGFLAPALVAAPAAALGGALGRRRARLAT